MDRRNFVTTAGGALALVSGGRAIAQEAEKAASPAKEEPFKVLFAPCSNHFKGGGKTPESYLDGLKKAYDLGFRAWEDNWLMRRDAALQEKVGAFLKEHDMTMGVSVVTTGHKAKFYDPTPEQEEATLADCRKAVEMAARVGHKWFTFIPGIRDDSSPRAEQIQASTGLMKRCCDIFDEAELVFVLEPLSHPMGGGQVLLESFDDGSALCKAVDRPSCKLLADFYHQQQVGGDLMKNADKNWDQIAYVQYGDVPGRKQPGTGEVNFINLTKHLVEKGYKGVFGLEHGIQGKLEDLVKAYREIDAAL